MIKRFISNPCNTYFTLWCVYLLQGTLYASGTIVSRVCLALILCVSFAHFCKQINDPVKSYFFKGWTTLIIMYMVYGVALFLTDGSRTQAAWHPATFTYLKGYLVSLLPIGTCYIYAKKGFLNAKMLQRWCVVFVIVGIAQYFRMQHEVLSEMAAAGSSKEEITNNIGYVMLSLIPCMMVYYKRPLLQYVGIGICSVFVLMGMKRGAVVICAFVLMLLVWYKIKNAKGGRKLAVMLVITIGLVLLFGYVEDLLATSSYFNARLQQTIEGDSSGRDRIYSTLLNAYFSDNNILHLLIGRGADGTLKVYGNYAHNDWLETLINQGLLGLVVFFSFWIMFWKTIRIKPKSSTSRFTLFMIFCMLGLRTLFSMSIGDMSIYITSMLGYTLSDGFERDEQFYMLER